jgi:hypothetical protein
MEFTSNSLIFYFSNSESKSIMKLQEQLSKLYIDLESIEADKAPSRAAKILSGLGFSPEDQQRPTKYCLIYKQKQIHF